MYRGGRKPGAKNRVVRDACRRGHPRTPENTHVHAVTGRICCRVCERIWANRNSKRPDVQKKKLAIMRRWRAVNKGRERERVVARTAQKYAFLNAWKVERGCRECGERDPRCLDAHHRDPTEKEVNVSLVVWRWKHERLLAELAKCDVLCRNCHAKLHAAERVE